MPQCPWIFEGADHTQHLWSLSVVLLAFKTSGHIDVRGLPMRQRCVAMSSS